MLAKELPFKQIFASAIRPVVSEEKDRLMAIASLQELSSFLPYVDLSQNIDVLPIAFDACVINRGNKNGDIMDTDIALATYKSFIHKFIDLEHNRQRVIGVILTASLSEYGTGRPLREEDVRGNLKPFNVTLGGVLWKAVNENLCDLVEESNDPTSEHYMKISASWELGFSGYKIIEMPQGEKNLTSGVEVTNPELRQKVKKYLKCFGGSGVYNGMQYFRMPYEDVVAMGVGLTEKPAADVQGIAVPLPEEQPISTDATIAQEVAAATVEEKVEIISQPEIKTVIQERITYMKITSIDQITDETLKRQECTASVVHSFIAEELKKASEQYTAEKQEAAQASNKLQATAAELAKKIEEMQASLNSLVQEKESRAKIDAFNSRMTEIVASFEFPEDVMKVVVEDVKSLANDEAFASWKTKAATIFKSYDKQAIAATAKAKTDAEAAGKAKAEAEATEAAAAKAKEAKADDDDADAEAKAKKKDKKEAKASEEAIASAVEDTLDNADNKDKGLPNSTSASAPGLKEKYSTAFAEENFVIKM